MRPWRLPSTVDELSKGKARGVLEGLPIGVKDLFDVEGVRTTFGSPIYAERIATQDHLIVAEREARRRHHFGKNQYARIRAGAQTL